MHRFTHRDAITDAVIEQYNGNIDRALLRENRKTHDLGTAASADALQRFAQDVRRVGKRQRERP